MCSPPILLKGSHVLGYFLPTESARIAGPLVGAGPPAGCFSHSRAPAIDISCLSNIIQALFKHIIYCSKLYTSQSILRSQLLARNLIPIILFISLLYRMLPHNNGHQCIKDQCCQRIQTLEEPNVC